MMMKREKIIWSVAMILVIGGLMDVFSFKGIYMLSVSKEYIYYVYGAIVTIAALSATILTIVVSSFSDNYYGFSIKEIVNFQNDYLRVSKIIPVALYSIVLSTIILAMGLINLLVAILVAVVFLISFASKYIWKLVSDENFCVERVLYEINITLKKNIDEESQRLFKKLFSSMNNSIKINGITNIDKHLDVIKLSFEGSKISDEIFLLLDRELKNTFKIVSISIGFIPAISKVLELYNFMESEYSNFDRREIFLELLQKIQYFNDKELSSSNMTELSNGLESQDILEDSEKMFIIFHYFKNIYTNEIINKNVKNSLLDDLISHLCDFRYSDENSYDIVKQKSLLYIVRDFILTNKDIKDAETLLIRIANALYSRRYSQSEKRFETIALIYLAIYIYSEFETETLVQDHRNKLKTLIHSVESNIYAKTISFSTVIKSNFDQIVRSLWNIQEQLYKDFHFLEYFSPQSSTKTIVWEIDKGVSFAFYNYLLSYYKYKPIPFRMIENWDEIENKKVYINIMLSFFDHETKTIKDSHLEKMQEISNWIGVRDSLPLDIQKEMFNHLNEEMKGILDKVLERTVTDIPKVFEINSQLKEELKNTRELYGFNESINIEKAQEMQFRPLIVDLQNCNNTNNISARLSIYLEWFLNDQIMKQLSIIQLSFDENGVELLLNKLKSTRFDKRNYTYVDDWAFSKEVRQSKDFIELNDKIKSIKFEKTKHINSNIFFKKGCLDFNIQITEYKHEFLTDDECSTYAENFKVGDGIYKLKDTYLNKSKAMEVIKKGYRKELVSFKYKTKMNKGCGICIEFKYQR